MTETALMREIQVAIANLGHKIFRNNTGKLKDTLGRWVAFGLCKGSSDLIGLTKDGRFLAIEVKTATGRIMPEQQAFVEMVKAAGGIAGIVRSVDEALALVQGI